MAVVETIDALWCRAWAWRQASNPDHRESERGSVTIENVIWALAVIIIAGIVVAAITNYVTTEAGRIGEP